MCRPLELRHLQLPVSHQAQACSHSCADRSPLRLFGAWRDARPGADAADGTGGGHIPAVPLLLTRPRAQRVGAGCGAAGRRGGAAGEAARRRAAVLQEVRGVQAAPGAPLPPLRLLRAAHGPPLRLGGLVHRPRKLPRLLAHVRLPGGRLPARAGPAAQHGCPSSAGGWVVVGGGCGCW